MFYNVISYFIFFYKVVLFYCLFISCYISDNKVIMIYFEVWKVIERLILIYIIAVGSLYSLLVSLFLRNIVVEKER